MKLCRFQHRRSPARVGLILEDGAILDITAADAAQLASLLEEENLITKLNELSTQNLPRLSPKDVCLLSPVERQEVWAVGVTYLRSKKARMEESDFSATAYDKVYDAPRPELFFKSMPEKIVGPGEAVGIGS